MCSYVVLIHSTIYQLHKNLFYHSILDGIHALLKIYLYIVTLKLLKTLPHTHCPLNM